MGTTPPLGFYPFPGSNRGSCRLTRHTLSDSFTFTKITREFRLWQAKL